MDPLSIAASAASLAVIVIQSATTLGRWVEATRGANDEVQAFVEEMRTYSRALSLIDQNLRRPQVAAAVRQTAPGSELWVYISESLTSCHDTVKSLDRLLERLDRRSKASNPFKMMVKAIRLNMKTDTIARLRRQINSYKDVMQLALHMFLIIDKEAGQSTLETLGERIELVLESVQRNQALVTNRRMAESSFRISDILLPNSTSVDDAVDWEDTLLVQGDQETAPDHTEHPNEEAEEILTPSAEAIEADLGHEALAYETLTNVLHAARTVTSASSVVSVADNSSVISSSSSVSRGTLDVIDRWVWAEDGPSITTWAKVEAHVPRGGRVLGRFRKESGCNVENFVDLCDEIDGLSENPSLRTAAALLLFKAFQHWTTHSPALQGTEAHLLLKETCDAIKSPSEPDKFGTGTKSISKKGQTLAHLLIYLDWLAFLTILNERGAIQAPSNLQRASLLHYAAQCDRGEVILFLIEQGHDANVVDENSMTPLDLACERGGEIVAQILLNYTTNAMRRRGLDEDTILHTAIEKGLRETAELIIASASAEELVCADRFGHTPAIKGFYAHYDITFFDQLVRKGVDLDIGKGSGKGLLCLASEKGDEDLVSLILNHTALLVSARASDADNSGYPLYVACRKGEVGTIRLLLDHGYTVDSMNVAADRDLFFAAVQSGSQEALSILLDADPTRFLLAKNDKSQTPLHILCQQGMDGPAFAWLIDTMDLDIVDAGGNTPLHTAIIHRNVELAMNLLQEGASVNIKNTESRDPLHCVLRVHDLDLLKAVINAGANVESRDGTLSSPAHFAVLEGWAEAAHYLVGRGALVPDWGHFVHESIASGDNRPISLLLELGADIDQAIYPERTDQEAHVTRTALHLAVINDRLKLVRLLILGGADVSCTTDYESTPLHLAVSDGYVAITEFLLNHGASVRVYDGLTRTPLDIAIAGANLKIVKLLVENGALRDIRRPRSGLFIKSLRPLKAAIEKANVELVNYLLEQGVDVNEEYGYDKSPLHVAVECGSAKVVQLLIGFNADISKLAGRPKVSALHIAITLANIDIIRILLDNGAPVNQASGDGVYPLYMAVRTGEIDIVKMLLAVDGVKVNQKNYTSQETALLLAVKSTPHFSVPLNPSSPKCYHISPYFDAHDFLIALLKKGADCWSKDCNGMTPYEFARSDSRIPALEVMDAYRPKFSLSKYIGQRRNR